MNAEIERLEQSVENLQNNLTGTANNLQSNQNGLQEQIISLTRKNELKIQPGDIYKDTNSVIDNFLLKITEKVEEVEHLIKFKYEETYFKPSQNTTVLNKGIGIYNKTTNDIQFFSVDDTRQFSYLTIASVIESGQGFTGSRHLFGFYYIDLDRSYIVTWKKIN